MMNEDELKSYICHYNHTIIDAMKMIDKNCARLLYVLDDENKLIGCITDGDIRRWIIKGGSLDKTVSFAMNTAPISLPIRRKQEAFDMMKKWQIDSIGITDDNKHIVDVLFVKNDAAKINENDRLHNTPVIVMAGGEGTRLHPYTKILPKPLIPIGDIPILERVLNHFSIFGVKYFFITVNYRKEMIKSYFADTIYADRIIYVEEGMPLGTAGSIRLIDKEFSDPVIVTNCDILIEADYSDIMKFHKESGNDMTIVSSLKNTVIPYGVLQSKENGIVTSIKEKPEISNFINTGMYVLNPEFIKWIPENKMFHMTNLAEILMKDGKQVGMYPISENSFLDMGQFEEMKRMEERINSGDVS